jgi:hypothetical protein
LGDRVPEIDDQPSLPQGAGCCLVQQGSIDRLLLGLR